MIRNKAVETNSCSNARIFKSQTKLTWALQGTVVRPVLIVWPTVGWGNPKTNKSQMARSAAKLKNATLCSCRAVSKQPAGGYPNFSTVSLRPVLIAKFAARRAALCTRVRERRQVRRWGGLIPGHRQNHLLSEGVAGAKMLKNH